jgi:hypothetical protein
MHSDTFTAAALHSLGIVDAPPGLQPSKKMVSDTQITYEGHTLRIRSQHEQCANHNLSHASRNIIAGEQISSF